MRNGDEKMNATRDEIAIAMQHLCRVLDVQMPNDSTTIGEYFDDLLTFEIQELREAVKAIKRGEVFVRSGHFPSVKDFHMGVKAYRDFKKKAGFQEAMKRVKEWGVYHQNYCGCIYSLKEREEYEKSKSINL